MRMSCNGCRVLRKGCSADCSIEPCLKWIKNPESQASATLFLAKFYGRAGLINLINAAPPHSRTEIFRSLLYEACGRIINPVYGSVGLLWTGKWELCQKAVEAVLKGAPITQIASEVADENNGPPLKTYDIRHVNKEEKSSGSSDLHRVKTRCRFKKSGSKGTKTGRSKEPLARDIIGASSHESSRDIIGASSHESSRDIIQASSHESSREVIRASSHESSHDVIRASSHESSSLSHQSEPKQVVKEGSGLSPDSEEMTRSEIMVRAEPEFVFERSDGAEIDLDLSLGLKPLWSRKCKV